MESIILGFMSSGLRSCQCYCGGKLAFMSKCQHVFIRARVEERNRVKALISEDKPIIKSISNPLNPRYIHLLRMLESIPNPEPKLQFPPPFI
ncbi:hypothetical protein EYC80_008916 [Monilinia laxa]|uniref:Uncharacterized protein n=1 Tax=Monilinia laxa TaxID=61186 RepID=A0A5N6K1T8_MONLA|nr:hypothetical protein EYC80_008916 [Monilinia laxa]